MSDPSPPVREFSAGSRSPFGGDLGDPWVETYPEDGASGAERGGRGYRVRSEGVWAAARDEYVAGDAAETVCERYDLGLSAFRQRARREGWRRVDAEDQSPDLSPFPPEPEAAPPTGELADLAWRSAAQAIRRGRVYEARAWMKLSQALREEVRAEEKAKRWAAYLAKAAKAEEAECAADGADAAADGCAPDDVAEGLLGEDEAAELHGLHGEAGVQSCGREPGRDRSSTEAECAAAIADLEAQIAKGPALPAVETTLRDIKAVFEKTKGRSP